MVEDLRTSCSSLLEGIGSKDSPGSLDRMPAGPIGELLHCGSGFLALADGMTRALRQGQANGSWETFPSGSPKQAKTPREPWNYTLHEGRLLPRTWHAQRHTLSVDRAAVAWWLHVLEVWLLACEVRQRPILEQLVEARSIRSGLSKFAQGDSLDLESWVHKLQKLRGSIGHLAADLRGGFTVRSSRRPPLSLPPGPDWIRFRFLAAELEHPNLGAKSYLQAIQSQAFHKLSTPFLYQRWCGLKLIEALVQAGWVPEGNPSIKLLLGGQIHFTREMVPISLLVDPRFTRDKTIAGLKSRTFESTPDYVLVHSATTRPTVFILDPTLHTDSSERLKKSKYLDNLCLAKARHRFGLALLPGPHCSWAAAPLSDSVCRIDHPARNGATGTVPMNPLPFLDQPLAEWVAEFEATVRLNGLAEAAPRGSIN